MVPHDLVEFLLITLIQAAAGIGLANALRNLEECLIAGSKEGVLLAVCAAKLVVDVIGEGPDGGPKLRKKGRKMNPLALTMPNHSF